MKRCIAEVGGGGGEEPPDKSPKVAPADEPMPALQAEGAGLLHDAFDQIAALNRSRPAVEDETGRVWTYGELHAASVQMACSLLRLGGADGTDSPARALAVLMRRSCAWVAAALAASRLGLPLLALSGDLGTQDEVSRNRDALVEHRPRILVLDGALRASSSAAPALEAAAADGLQVVDADSLLHPSAPSTLAPACHCQSPDDPLYFVYTGGTTSASKCVAVTHRMAVHELQVYPKIAPLDCTDRVLHQSSAYWGATSLGILDVAWACGGCLVLVEGGAGPAEVAGAIQRHSLTVAGLVPSVLDALEAHQCPSLRVVFTWGEALSRATVARWAARVALLDLLIASEYWLILYADHRGSSAGGGQCGFRPVPGAQLTLLAPGSGEEGGGAAREGQAGAALAEVNEGEVGELFMAGPMVSAHGYTDAARNAGAFVDLPVGPSGCPVRHFRTRDLARRRPDGALEYCGRADGFAKVGGKWLDLAAVEQRLRAAGCREAVLVWDGCRKQRHAAVVLEPAADLRLSLAARGARLQALLPRDTHLHVLQELPHHPTTGKVHRGVLVKDLAAGVAAPRQQRQAMSRGVAGVRLSLLAGLALAARTGARGAAVLPLAWQLAPGLASDAAELLSGIPPAVGESVWNCACWHRAVGRELAGPRLAALPFIALLLMDAPGSGLDGLERLVKGPLGALGAAMLVCCHATPLLRALLVAAGHRRAEAARGGSQWPWAFWLGLPSLMDQWVHDRWDVYQAMPGCWDLRRARRFVSTAMAGAAVAYHDGPRLRKPVRDLDAPELCGHCWEWSFEGAEWQERFYCRTCTDGWEDYQRRREVAPEPVAAVCPAGANGSASPLQAAGLGAPVSAANGGVVQQRGGGAEAASAAGARSVPNGTQPPVVGTPPSAAAATFSAVAVAAAVGSATNGATADACSAAATANAVSGTPAGGKPGRAQRVPLVDEVNFTESEVETVCERWRFIVGQASAPPQRADDQTGASSTASTPVARIVERAAGLHGAEPSTSLSHLESLKVIAVVSALRRELGLDLAAVDVAACSTLGELEELCSREAAPQEGGQAPDDGQRAGAEWAIYAIPRFWKAPIGWLIRLDEVPNEAAMRVACRALVRRHHGLRALPYSTMGDVSLATLCNRAAPQLLALRALLGGSGAGLCRRAAEGLWEVWPRIRALPPDASSDGSRPLPELVLGLTGGWLAPGVEEAHFEWHCFATEGDLRHAAFMRARTRGFKLPASIAVLVLDAAGRTDAPAHNGSRSDVAYLHVSVNHAVTDAAAIVPIVADLLELHKVALAAIPPGSCMGEQSPMALDAAAVAALAAAALPPVPNGLQVQQSRLMQALLPAEGGAQGGARQGLDLAHSVFHPRFPGYDHFVRLLPGTVRLLEMASRIVGVPSDHLLVVALATAFGRISGKQEVKVSLIVPMRDARGEGQIVANLATTRHLKVWLGGGRSLLAASLDLSACLRRREWGVTDILGDDGDRLFVNLRAVPRMKGAAPAMESVDTARNSTRYVRNSIEMFADQESVDQWTLWMGIRDELKGSDFARALREIVWALAMEPVETAALPSPAAGGGA